jgi:signal transduction histidine kinase
VPWARTSAFVAAGLAGGFIVLGLIGSRSPRDVAFVGIITIVTLPATVLGVIIARRVPTNPVGALLVCIGLVPCVLVGLQTYEKAALAEPGRIQLPDAVASLMQSGTWLWLYATAALLVLYFPDGKLLPGRRWRFVMVGLLVESILFTVVGAVATYDPPFEHVHHAFGQIPKRYEVYGLLFLPPFLALLIASAVSIRVRYRSGTPEARAQLKWFVLAGATVPGTLFLAWAGVLLPVVGGVDFASIGLACIYVGLAAATAVAMLRHELYDVDRAISTTLTYSLLTVGVLTFWTLASFFVAIALGGQSSIAAAALAAACAVSLAPVRRRIQAIVDRRFYPIRQRALAAIDDLRLRTHAGLARPEQLEEALRMALDDPSLAVGYVSPDNGDIVDASGMPLAIDRSGAASVSLGGQQVGMLLPARRTSPDLLRVVADASALLVEMVRLRLELGQALRDVESSRARLLRAGYEERRRVVNDLHDGAQQRLVSMGMSLRLAQRHLHDGTIDLDGLLDQSVAELATAVAELRQLAHGLRPSSLDDGLDSALFALTSNVPLPVDLDVRAGDLPDVVSTTAYYVASEGIANAVKHSDADRLSLEVVRIDEGLRVRVADNGRGGAVLSAGSGLPGLTDRVAALGGSLVVHSPPGRGTVLEAVLPCGS